MSGIDYNAYGWTREFLDHYLLEQEWSEWQLRGVRAAWLRSSSPAAESGNAPNAPASQQSLRASSEDSYIPQSITTYTSDLLPQPSTPSMASQQGTNTLMVRPEWHTSSPPSLEPHTPGTPVSLSSLAGPPMELVPDEAPYGLADNFPEGRKYWRTGTFNPAYSPTKRM
ncbi:hypothetical protein DID88_005195 [Monilinia fructigena]|uniref:Uncharacterized protein n=1 Tax=Monilinia fructigena TaxID=38457 RepID=A0A395IEA9_9HELO|nr:hypothetical protein DID88_005195 [Monilinia fructigena]